MDAFQRNHENTCEGALLLQKMHVASGNVR